MCILLIIFASVIDDNYVRAICLIGDKQDALYKKDGVCPHVVMI
jgi:hypothetical protein